MDSFYDAPRRPPAPLSKEMLTAVPMVPEISVLCSSNAPRNAFVPYRQWKQEQQTPERNFFSSNKENIDSYMQNPQNISILKKQVRFESPVLQPQPLESKIDKNAGKPNISPGPTPSFEQMYMANIPNRQLDLSIIDLPKRLSETKISATKEACQPIKEKETPKTYKEFLKFKTDVVLNDSVTDIFNYKGNVGNSPKTPSLTPSEITGGPNIDYIHSPNEAPTKQSEKYFQCVSQAISQRSPYKPLDVTKDFKTLEQPAEPLPKQKMGSSENVPLHNRIFTFSPVAERVYETHHSKAEASRQENINDIENLYKQTETDLGNHIPKIQKKCDCCATNGSERNALRLKSDDDFSTKDLLKIIAQQSQQIAQQNNQILLLQQQVTDLIAMQKHSEYCRQKGNNCCQKQYLKNDPSLKQISDCREKCVLMRPEDGCKDRCITTSTQREVVNGEPNFLGSPKNKNQLPNFSIGLTTSFEVSFRRPAHRNPNEFLQQKNRLYEPEPPIVIQEITETESTRTNGNCMDEQRFHKEPLSERTENDNNERLVDASMIFGEPIQVREACPSPEPSIKINMNDFEDSEDSDDGSTQVDTSFYRNLMAQVNKILQKAQIETAEGIASNMTGSNLNNNTMNKVKEATLKHLRKIGVNLPHIEENSRNSSSPSTDGKFYNEEDISFAVKQLLMKYLPADHLAKLADKGDHFVFTPKEKIGAIKRRPEFSFASVQYMQKYNLIANNQKDFNQRQRQSPKILDITKLKQQPKLL